MAISPPSDILLDVANAADPAKVRLATAKLARLASDPAATSGDFGQAMSAAARTGKAFAPSGVWHPIISGTKGGAQPPKSPEEAYQKFESVLLQQFIESMLPKNEQLYGDKNSAAVYRSMMAEQFANQIAKAGGIGIAKSIVVKHPAANHPAANHQSAAHAVPAPAVKQTDA